MRDVRGREMTREGRAAPQAAPLRTLRVHSHKCKAELTPRGLWLYLEPILCNDDGDLGIKFRKVDQGFKQVTRLLESDPRISAVLQSARLQPMLDAISDQLNACQSALNQYIDDKRSIFPRLYFLSDDDLLELLGQARADAEGKGAVMQSHLKKLFPGITGVHLGPSDLSITALCSHGEIFQLDHPVDIDCSVELWLKNLEQEMRSSLQSMVIKCLVSNSLQDQDPFSLPTQILCLSQIIRFTEQTEKAIISKELHTLKNNIENENSYYADVEVEDETKKYKKQALILQCAFYGSMVQDLIEHNVVTLNDWHWQKQLRFYSLKTKEIVIKMGLAEISYSYEYLGVNTGQFVRTETTDESFLILTQALHLGLVGNPFGPAGTGKTESVKALGALVGRLVLVFNCDEAMDAECMGRLLSGVAQCGAWGCFDEFNRLSADTLAAVSHQLASLLGATRARAAGADPVAVLNGKQVSVSPWCGVAATMNPAGRGYGGRRALPPALQHALRPLALRPPARAELAARLLAAALGPATARRLATDLDDVFTLASTLLSNQRHYDWGLRALKSAVGSCSAALSARGPCAAPAQRALLRKVLRLNNISKLTVYDAERFENILSMVFADVPEEESATDPVYSSLKAAVTELGLVHSDFQIQKCMELYEQLQQRMGVAIVGPPGSGKSTIRKLLKTAMQQRGRSVAEYVISPKAQRRRWLLGGVQRDARGAAGVLAAVALAAAAQPAEVWSWVVCDGDVEPEWVEALNSVLDDNRLLTLPSGWRVQFGHNVNFIFETHSLEHASPATISRMGIILFSNEYHCSEEILESWIRKKEFDNETARLAASLLHQTVRKILQWISSHRADFVIRDCQMSLVKQILAQFEYIVEEDSSKTPISAEDIVWSSVQLSIMGLLKNNAIDTFYDELQMPHMPAPQPDADAEWAESLLLSARVRAAAPALRAAQRAAVPALVLGSEACAKNLLAEFILKETNSTVITIDCTPILEPSDIIAELKRNNAVSSGGGGGGGGGGGAAAGGCTLLLRALHRSRADRWGSSLVHSFILQLVQQGGFWAQEEGGPQWLGARRVRVLATAAAALPSPRLAALLYPVVLPEPDENELLELSRNYLSETVPTNVTEKDILNLSHSILSLYTEVTETFHSKAHYKWNPSHLRLWCQNIKWYSPSNLEGVLTALNAEANILFKERLVTDDEKSQYSTIAQNYIKINNDVYFKPKLRGDGIYLESVEYKEWHESTEKLINQCLIDDEYVFGDTGIEVCKELSVLCPTIALALNGDVVTCAAAAGAGRRAAARLVCTALGASLVLADQPAYFCACFKNALTSASEGTHTLLVMTEAVAADDCLAHVEAFLKADSIHSLPSKIIPTNYAQSAQSFTEMKHKLGILVIVDKEEELSSLWEAAPLLLRRVCWLRRWSRATLQELPARLLHRLSKENSQEMSEEDLDNVPIEGFISIYESLETETTRAPVRYLHFIKTYYNIYNSKKQALNQRQETLSAGVKALEGAQASVDSLRHDAAQQEAALAEQQAAAARALQQLSAAVRADTDRREEMHLLKQTVETENEKLQIRKKEIEAELASVEPVIAAARAAVGDIRPEALSEVRSLRAPPDVVRDVLEGVLRLMGIADTSWHSMKSFLSKRGVKEDIRCLDASQISSEAVQSVERLLERRGASFEQAAARRASAACAPLAAWVRANLAHARALARVRPLQDQQRDLHRNLTQAEAEVSALSDGLASVEERVAALQAALGQHARDAAALELRLAATASTLRAAADLLRALEHEYRSWEADLKNISQEILELGQRSLLAAGYLIYLPDLTEPQARQYLSKWSTLIGYEDTSFSVINFLTTPEQLLKWEADGLPLDESAIKNAVFIDQYLSRRCSLAPLAAGAGAAAWLRALPGDALPLHSERLHTALHCAAKLGRVLIITDVERIEEWWWSALRAGGGRGGRVLLQARAAPALAPHHAAHLALLHFTPRLHALVDQLLHYAMQKHNPEMNEKSKEIKVTKATLQKQQHELQENLLKDLSSNSDILHDASLLESLKKTQSTSATIREALAAAQALQREARDASARYEAGATRAARLALAVQRLAARHARVAAPPDDVRDAFLAALHRTTNETETIDNDEIVKHFTRKIIERVLLSLHKKDKYIVVMHLLHTVYDDLMPDKLWQIFIGNVNLIEDMNILTVIKKKYQWINDDCLRKIAQIKIHDEDLFLRLSLEQSDLWLDFQSSGDLHTISKLNLRPFEVILAVAALRPESCYRAIVAFVDQVLGGSVVSAEAVGAAARWARRARPALLLAPHAADALAATARASGRTLATVGIEGGPSAWEAALAPDGWLAVVVGASPFTKDLLSFVASLSERPLDELGDDFRLWIVAEDREIPSTLANSCVNVVIEPPEGVKRNACGTLAAWARALDAPQPRARLLARLALLHAIVQERRNYIPFGWSRYYAWEWGDVSACAAATRAARDEAGARALVGALYAARVAAARDRDVLRALLARCLRDAVPALDAVPPDAHLNDYITALEALPDMDAPQLLELPANCRVAWENNAADNIIAGLRELNSATFVKRDDTTTPLKNILSLWRKLMSGSPLLKPNYHIEKRLGGWWGALCEAEARDAAAAARALHAALAAGARAPRPQPLHQVPDEWQLVWAGPDTPEIYIEEFCVRARAALDRVESYEHTDDYMPKEVDLREYLRPERVLAALSAAAARRRGCALHALALSATWDCTTENKDGVVVRGLRVCGARWAGALCAARARDAPHAPAPPLLLRYVPTEGAGATGAEAEAGGALQVCVYASAAREAELARVRAPLHAQYAARAALLHAPALHVADAARRE